VGVAVILMLLPFLLSINAYYEHTVIPDWIKDSVGKLMIQNNFNKSNIMQLLENLSNIGVIKNITHTEFQTDIPHKRGILVTL